MADSPFIEDPILRAKVLREYPYDFEYYDWCLTVLNIGPKIDLDQSPLWHASIRRLCETTCPEAVLWSRDLEQTHTLLVLARVASKYSEEDVASAWIPLEPLLLCSPQVKHLVLNMKDYFPAATRVQELILVEGDRSLMTSPYLTNVDTFVLRATPTIGHDPPEELTGCARGITQPDAKGFNTIAILSVWLGLEERRRSKDPTEPSYDGGSEYEDRIARSIRGLKGQGANVVMHLLRLELWRDRTTRAKTRQRCIIL